MAAFDEKEYTKSFDLKIWKRLLPILGRFKPVFLGMLAFNGLTALLDVVIPLFQKYAIGGFIEAGRVSAGDIRVDDLECASVACTRLIAKRVETSELFASESAAVSCYLCADYVAADRLTVALHEVGKIDAR